jgi:hypothetical protein
MKHLSSLLAIGCWLLAVTPVFAQTFNGGFYAGAAVSGIEGLEANNDNSFGHLGFTVAGTVSTKISPKTRVQFEIRFIQRGGSQAPRVVDSSAGTYNNYFRLTLNYVDAVIGIKRQIHFTVRNEDKDLYGMEAGVSVGYLVNSSYEVQSIVYSIATHPVDISPYIGLYYNITPHFYAETRFSNSVNSALVQNNVSNPYFLYYSSFDDGHNMGFIFTLGFLF